MRSIQAPILCLAIFSCAGPQAGATADAAPAAPAKDAASFEVHGLKVDRPTDWQFVAPDPSVVPDTVAILHGPPSKEMRAVVEISRRELSAADRKRPVERIVTALSLEIAQTFSAFDAEGNTPQDIEVAGMPASMMRMKVTEMLGDGSEADRTARIYGVVQDSQMWVIRCFGPPDGTADSAFDAIIGSLQFDG